MPHEAYVGLLKALAQQLRGVDPVAFVEAQNLAVSGRRIEFSLERDAHDAAEDRLIVRCDVLRLPAPASESISRKLLRANNLWAGTRGATLGLRGDDEVILSVPARIGSFDGVRLAVMVAGLLGQADVWALELGRNPGLNPNSNPTPSPSSAFAQNAPLHMSV